MGFWKQLLAIGIYSYVTESIIGSGLTANIFLFLIILLMK